MGFIFGIIIMICSQSYAALMFGRVFVGLGVGFGLAVSFLITWLKAFLVLCKIWLRSSLTRLIQFISQKSLRLHIVVALWLGLRLQQMWVSVSLNKDRFQSFPFFSDLTWWNTLLLCLVLKASCSGSRLDSCSMVKTTALPGGPCSHLESSCQPFWSFLCVSSCPNHLDGLYKRIERQRHVKYWRKYIHQVSSLFDV